jgi:hypothetical protein
MMKWEGQEKEQVYIVLSDVMHLEFQGSWIVRQSVGSTPCLLGKAVDITYIRGANYLEVRLRILLKLMFVSFLFWLRKRMWTWTDLTHVLCCTMVMDLCR